MPGHAKKLNPRQVRFVHAVVQGHTWLDAGRLAGYKGKTDQALEHNAREVAKIPIVAAEISRLRTLAAQAAVVDLAWWLQELAVQYHNNKDWTGDPQAALRALDMIGKHLGAYDKTHDARAREHGLRMMENMTELMLLQKKVQARIDGRVPPAREGLPAEVLAMLPPLPDESLRDPVTGLWPGDVPGGSGAQKETDHA